MPNFVALGCLEVGEKFVSGGVDHIPSTVSHQPKQCCVKVWSWGLGWTVTIPVG